MPTARGRQWRGIPATSSGTSGRSSTTTRVPPGASSSVHSTRDGIAGLAVVPAEAEPAPLLDLLDDALALGAAVPPDGAQRRALLGLELDLVGEPLAQLGGLGQQLPGAVALDGQDDLSADGGQGSGLLQLDGCG